MMWRIKKEQKGRGEVNEKDQTADKSSGNSESMTKDGVCMSVSQSGGHGHLMQMRLGKCLYKEKDMVGKYTIHSCFVYYHIHPQL